MSSKRSPVNRKRLHSPDFGDSDREDEPPFKKYDRNPLRQKSVGSELPDTIKSKLKSFAVWITDLPVKHFFTMAIKSGSNVPEETILIDDDEEEEVSVQKVKKGDISKLKPLIEKIEKSQKLLSSDCRYSRRHLELNGSHSISSCYDAYRINGSSSRDWNSRCNENGNYSRESRIGNLKRPAIVSNPETDIEILLGTKREVSAPEADEIEILSESPSTKQKLVSSQKSLHVSSKSSAAKNSASCTDQNQNHTSSVKRLQSSSPKCFTANEVVRLQEKAQYKLLLEKYISGSHYHYVSKKSQSDAGVQADSNLFSGSHFKKEVLQQPVDNFIQKYCKPCQLLSPDKVKQSSEKKKEPSEVKIDEEDEDDELQILEVKLPEYKPKYHSTKYFSPEWISELKNNVRSQTEERLKIVEDQERMLERYKKERLLNRLRVEVPVCQAVEPEFPELTPEMEEAVDKALNTGAPDDRLCKITSDYLLRKDIETLSGLNWLNDLVINSYFDLIVERSKQEGYPSIHAYNTFFYTTYKAKGYVSVRRWTRKLDIFSFDLNFVPIHLGVHWCLAVIDHRSKKICYYDSMGNGEEQCLDLLHEYLCLEYKDKKGAYLDPSIYTTENMKDIPQQMNGSDCGMFTLKYAEYISRDAEITFNQGHMQYFRRRMVYELLTCQLL